MKLLRNTPLQDTRVDQKNTPKYWRRIRNWSIIIGAVAVAVATGGAGLPAAVITIATVIGTVATTAAAVAATTKD